MLKNRVAKPRVYGLIAMTAGLQLKIRGRASPDFLYQNLKHGGDEIAVSRKHTIIIQLEESEQR